MLFTGKSPSFIPVTRICAFHRPFVLLQHMNRIVKTKVSSIWVGSQPARASEWHPFGKVFGLKNCLWGKWAAMFQPILLFLITSIRTDESRLHFSWQLVLTLQVASVLTLKVVALFVAKEPFNGLLYKKEKDQS